MKRVKDTKDLPDYLFSSLSNISLRFVYDRLSPLPRCKPGSYYSDKPGSQIPTHDLLLKVVCFERGYLLYVFNYNKQV